MNLPEMLRHRDVAARNMNSFTYGPNIGPELAALVEAADNLNDASRGDDFTDEERAAYLNARAALAAKIGGKG